MTNYLRSCAGCSAHIVIQFETERDVPVYCTKCKRINDESWTDFDPQPYRKVDYGQRPPDSVIRRWSHPSPVFGDWCVLARDGDRLTVRPLGRPDAEPIDIHISDARPRSDRRM